MAHRVIDAVLKTITSKQKSNFKASHTENIALTTNAMASYKDVKNYRKLLI
jgi:hypothetical protein